MEVMLKGFLMFMSTPAAVVGVVFVVILAAIHRSIRNACDGYVEECHTCNDCRYGTSEKLGYPCTVCRRLNPKGTPTHWEAVKYWDCTIKSWNDFGVPCGDQCPLYIASIMNCMITASRCSCDEYCYLRKHGYEAALQWETEYWDNYDKEMEEKGIAGA